MTMRFRPELEDYLEYTVMTLDEIMNITKDFPRIDSVLKVWTCFIRMSVSIIVCCCTEL